MEEPVPVQPVTLDYSNAPAALGAPIRHPGMELPPAPGELRTLVRQGVLGALVAATIIAIAWRASDLLFPSYSHLRLARPVLPLVGMFATGMVAKRMSVEHARRGWPIGLWVGGFVLLGLYGTYLIGTGHVEWVTQLF